MVNTNARPPPHDPLAGNFSAGFIILVFELKFLSMRKAARGNRCVDRSQTARGLSRSRSRDGVAAVYVKTKFFFFRDRPVHVTEGPSSDRV
jgi:hypothetical protein